MAAEFGARWLGVRDFVANHGRNLKQFPEFTPDLRDALAKEPVRFFEDLLVNDRPVADVIAVDAVVVNDLLARHYGIPGVTGSEWRRVEKVSAYGRGGLLGFGAVLAKTSGDVGKHANTLVTEGFKTFYALMQTGETSIRTAFMLGESLMDT